MESTSKLKKESPQENLYTHTIKRKENAEVELSITVSKKHVKQNHEKILSEVAKEAHIKGFRKGQVPQSILLSKFGPYIQAKCIDSIVNDAFGSVVDKIKEKPLPYSSPTTVDMDEKSSINPEEDFTFTIRYDTDPRITLAELHSLELTMHAIKIQDSDVQKELEGLQEKNAIFVERKGFSQKGDLIHFDFVELDEQQKPKEETRTKDNAVTVGQVHTPYELNEELEKLSIAEKKVITKTYPKDHATESLAGKTVQIELEVSKIQEKKLPDIDDELAQDIHEKYSTLSDLKKDLKAQLITRAEEIQFEAHKGRILDYLLVHSTSEIPESATRAQFESTLQRLIQQSGTDEANFLKTLAKTKEDFYQSWKKDMEKQVNEQFIVSESINQKKIQTKPSEVEDKIREENEKTGQNNADEVIAYYREHNLLHQIQYEMSIRKLFEALIEECKTKKGKELSFQQLIELQEKENKKNYNT